MGRIGYEMRGNWPVQTDSSLSPPLLCLRDIDNARSAASDSTLDSVPRQLSEGCP